MRKVIHTITGLLSLGLMTTAWGQDVELFGRLDTNEDGVLTAEEVGEEKKSLFERMLGKADKNKDGKLSKEEFTASLQDAPLKDAPAPGGGRFPPGEPKEMIARIDKNGDGKIQKEEAPERMREGFDRMDTNKDGSIDLAEFGRFAAMIRGENPPANPNPASPNATPNRPEGNPNFPPFARIFDADGNGEISASEIASAGDALKKLDKNGDGKLTGEELLSGAGAPPPGRPAGGPLGNMLNPAEMLKRADANGDGKLSKEEAPERLRERFDNIDANQDGFLDEGEFRKMFERLREQLGKKKGE